MTVKPSTIQERNNTMKLRTIFWGIFFICAAALIVSNQMGYLVHVSFWSLVITILMVPVVIESAVRLNFFGVFFPLALIAIVFHEPIGIGQLGVWPILGAALLLSIGFSMIFRRKNASWLWKYDAFRHGQYRYHRDRCSGGQGETLDGDDLNCSISFSSNSKYFHSKNLQRASLTCAFGDLKVFFDNAQLSENGAEIFIDCSFGEIELFIPKAWNVANRITPSFGNVKEKNWRENVPGPMLTLSGSVSFGSVKITYI